MNPVAYTPRLNHPMSAFILRLEQGESLIPESADNVLEVVGVLKSYGMVLDAYWRNLIHISEHQFLVQVPILKYFNGEVTPKKFIKHLFHDRINFEFAEYCMKAMFYHGGGGLDQYLDSPEFSQRAQIAIQAKGHPLVNSIGRLFPDFALEQIRQLAYYSALGQFWRVMSPMFLHLSDRYDRGEITSIAQIVAHVRDGLVAAAAIPITYKVQIKGQDYDLIPLSAGLTFLMDAGVPYVEAVFLRSLPFLGTVSYNAQAGQIPSDMGKFSYGALFADPLPIGGAGIPPTLLMRDMARHLPPYLAKYYQFGPRTDDVGVKLCISFQKSMFCVTTAAITGLAPHALGTTDPEEQIENRKHFLAWIDRLTTSRLRAVN